MRSISAVENASIATLYYFRNRSFIMPCAIRFASSLPIRFLTMPLSHLSIASSNLQIFRQKLHRLINATKLSFRNFTEIQLDYIIFLLKIALQGNPLQNTA
jgi:hypothetical protein